MNLFQKLFYYFSGYTDPTEREVSNFFEKLNETSPKNKIIKTLLALMQKNIVVMNLYSEHKYKGYKYLTKNKRKQLYQNTELIKTDFEVYMANSTFANSDDVINEISKIGINTQLLQQNTAKLMYLSAIMGYFSPNNGRYKYRASSTFGELLKNPKDDLLVGDCNQILTLYIYFYSLKYNISDLQIKTYPGHVALHFLGVDIETTNGEFKNYQVNGQKILAVQEIISINLLDTTDSYFQTHKVSPELFLQSARLAYLVSSEKEIVNKNLETSYNNTVSEFIDKGNYDLALKYAKQSGNNQLLNIVGHNGAIYHTNNNQFAAAIKYANYSNNKNDILHNIYTKQGALYYNSGQYHNAIKAYTKVNDHKLVRQCYEALFASEQKKLGKLNTADDVKQNASTIRKMHSYAKKSENKKLIDYTNSLTKYL